MFKIVSITYLRIIYLLSSLGCGSSHLLGSSSLDDAHSNGLRFKGIFNLRHNRKIKIQYREKGI